MKTPALILCLIFVVFVLVRDTKRRKTVSWAIWLPTIYLIIVGSRPLSSWFGGNGWSGQGLANSAEGSPIDQVFFFSLLVGSFIVATSRGAQWGKLFTSNLPLMLFYGYFILSILWSEDPMGSSKRMFKDFGMLFVMGLMLTEKNPLEAIGAVYVRCACVLFPFSAVCIRWVPEVARRFALNGDIEYMGVTTQKNTMGEIAIVFSLFTVWDYLETKPAKFRWSKIPWDRILVLLMGVWCLQMCQSKTGLLCLLIGAGLLLRRGWLASKLVSRVAFVSALCVPYILFFAQQYSSVIAPIVALVGRNMTFTGRADIWQHINLDTVNPVIGYGFYNFWGGTGGQRVNQLMGETIPNAHDGYVDLYLDGGVIGLILLCFMLISYSNRLIKILPTQRIHRLRFAMLVAAIIYNVSESNWARLSAMWFTTVLVLSYVPSLRPAAKRLPRPETAVADPGRSIVDAPAYADRVDLPTRPLLL